MKTCGECGGTGLAKTSHTCPRCKGVIVEVGYCPDCLNAGRIADLCGKCGGSKVVK